MRKLAIVLALCAVMLQAHATIIYVNQNATGANTGTSWTNAYTSLQSGISATVTGDQIWVAAGTYKPTATTNRSIYFVMPSGVSIYGGFAGTETLLSQRDWVANSTVLSGDIGTTGYAYDNSYHVVYAYSVTSNTRLDGFTIRDGYARDISYNYYGGGLYIANSSMTVANCIFTNNSTNSAGAAIAQTGSGGPTTGILNLSNCSLVYNTGGTGAALYLRGTQSNITHCNISDNNGSEVVYISDGTANIDRCVISGNNTSGGYGTMFVENLGGAINMYNSLVAGNLSDNTSGLEIRPDDALTQRIWNCTFAGNKSTGTSTAYNATVVLSTYTNMSNCIVYGNYNGKSVWSYSYGEMYNNVIEGSPTNNTGANNTATDPLFVHAGNASLAPFDTTGLNYQLTAASPALNNGDNTYTTSPYLLDLLDSTRISGITVDRGCYEHQYCAATVAITPSGATSFCQGGLVSLSASTGSSYAWSNGASAQTTAVNVQGTYTVTVIDGNGCFGTASQAVTVYPASVQISGNTVLCPNSSTTLTASSPDGNIYQWSNSQSAAAVTVTQGGTYTVTVTTLNSCTATASSVVTIHNTATPVISQSGNVLTSSASAGNQWYLNGTAINGATGHTYTATQSGTYTVVVTESGCTSDASAAQNVIVAGISTIAPEGISIYPNPATNMIMVTGMHINTPIEITDLLGKVVLHLKATSENQSVNIEGLAPGMYLLNGAKFIKE